MANALPAKVQKLTALTIDQAKPGPRDLWLKDGGSPGLYLRVRTGGSKVFVLRLKRGGKVQVRTLGAWPDYRLNDARAEAAKASARRSGRVARLTVKAAMEEFWRDHIEANYKRTASPATYRREVERVIGTRPADDVRAGEVADMVRGYRPRGLVAANRLLAFTGLFFKWAVEAGYCETNPCADLSRRIAGGEERSRERVLTDAEIRDLWACTSPHGNLLRALLLTGCRIGELQRAERAQLLGDRLDIPDTKSGRPHWVHVTPEAREQFDGGESFLFSQRSDTAVQAWVRRWQKSVPGAWTPHDLRRTFATIAGNVGIQPHIIRRLLNHAEEGSLPVYLRSEYEPERIAATKAIAARLAEVVKGNAE